MRFCKKDVTSSLAPCLRTPIFLHKVPTPTLHFKYRLYRNVKTSKALLVTLVGIEHGEVLVHRDPRRWGAERDGAGRGGGRRQWEVAGGRRNLRLRLVLGAVRPGTLHARLPARACNFCRGFMGVSPVPISVVSASPAHWGLG